MKPVNIGIIGPGWASTNLYATAIMRRPELRLHSVYSRSIERAKNFASEFPSRGTVRAYDDLQAMLANPELEAVAIVNPDGLHCDSVLQCAKAGKSVLVEKPMALSSGDCEAMIRACDEANVKLSIGYRLRYHGGHKTVMKHLHHGTFGKLRLVRMHMALNEMGNGDWRNSSAKLGKWWALSKFGTHLVDLALWATNDRPTSDIQALTGIVRNGEGQSDRDSAISWSYADGPTVQLVCSNTWDDGMSWVELHCDKACIEMTDTVGFHCGGPITVNGEDLAYELEWEFDEQLVDLASAIRNDGTPRVTGHIGLENVRVLEMCDERARHETLSA